MRVHMNIDVVPWESAVQSGVGSVSGEVEEVAVWGHPVYTPPLDFFFSVALNGIKVKFLYTEK